MRAREQYGGATASLETFCTMMKIGTGHTLDSDHGDDLTGTSTTCGSS